MIYDKDGNPVLNEDGTPVGSVEVPPEPEDEPEPVEEDEGDDARLSSLLKADLVERAEALGIDTTGMKKAELVEALEQAEGMTDGDD